MNVALSALIGASLSLGAASSARAAEATVALVPDAWDATVPLRFESYLGRPSLYLERGIALVRGAGLRDGTIELDMALPKRGLFMGVAFHATSTQNSEIVYVRPAESGTPGAVQYGPALNGTGVAWQIYQDDGDVGQAPLAFERWTHLKIDLAGPVATLYLDGDPKPVMTVPRLAGIEGTSIGVWAGPFGRGSYFSNIRYTPRSPAPGASSAPSQGMATNVAAGTLTDWELSDAFDASSVTPGTLPDFGSLRWEKVQLEDRGLVLINRYRAAPQIDVPTDPATHEVLVDRVMSARDPGSKVVFAHTVIQADRDQVRRMLIGYSNGVLVYCNGRPLFFGANEINIKEMNHGDMPGDAVYLPLVKGRNDVVLAVTNYTGGWGFWARLDP